MSAYRVNIDGRVYEGDYHTKANAVFGAMLKDESDLRNEIRAHYVPLDAHRPYCNLRGGPKDWHGGCSCDADDAYNAAYAEYQRIMDEPSLIGVEEITDRKVVKRVHRVNEEG